MAARKSAVLSLLTHFLDFARATATAADTFRTCYNSVLDCPAGNRESEAGAYRDFR
jgi:hypothetical protein